MNESFPISLQKSIDIRKRPKRPIQSEERRKVGDLLRRGPIVITNRQKKINEMSRQNVFLQIVAKRVNQIKRDIIPLIKANTTKPIEMLHQGLAVVRRKDRNDDRRKTIENGVSMLKGQIKKNVLKNYCNRQHVGPLTTQRLKRSNDLFGSEKIDERTVTLEVEFLDKKNAHQCTRILQSVKQFLVVRELNKLERKRMYVFQSF